MTAWLNVHRMTTLNQAICGEPSLGSEYQSVKISEIETIRSGRIDLASHQSVKEDAIKFFQRIPYTFGLFLGDGTYDFSINRIKIISLDRDSLEYSMKEIEKAVNVSPKITIIGNYYCLAFGKKCGGKHFKLFAAKHIPEEIYTSWDMPNVREFIAGLMDSDGYISQQKTKWQCDKFEIGFVSCDLVYDFVKVLNYVGLQCGKITKKASQSPKQRDCFQLYIPVVKYCEAMLYFRCQRKQQRLENYKRQVLGL